MLNLTGCAKTQDGQDGAGFVQKQNRYLLQSNITYLLSRFL